MALTDEELVDAATLAQRIDDERKPIMSKAGRSVSALTAAVDEALDMAIYVFNAKRDGDPVASDKRIGQMTADFQNVFTQMPELLEKMAVIESFGAMLRDENGDLILDAENNPQPDNAQRSANLDAAIVAYPALDPATYETRKFS